MLEEHYLFVDEEADVVITSDSEHRMEVVGDERRPPARFQGA